jgi:PAS domain S-box-containing protein
LVGDIAHEFKELADHAPVMIWRARPDKGCDYFNQPWLEFRGRGLEQELGTGWTEGVHPEDLQGCLQTYLGAFDQRGTFSMDYRLRRHDGEYRWVLDNGKPFFRSDGAFAGYLGSCIDITDRKLAEETMRAALDGHEHMLLENETLLAEVHHRVRNNLQVMLGLVGMSKRHVPDPACRSVLDSFADRIQTLAIVQTHLHEADHVSRIELKAYATALANALAGLYGGDHVTIVISGDRYPLPPHDANTVGLILSEVLSNSFKHAFGNGRQGKITIEIVVESDTTRVAVADDGPGFPKEPARHKQPGGLGLALVRTYAGQIGARVAQSSSNGTRFEIAFPRHH